MDMSESNVISSAFASPTFGKDVSFEVNKPVGSMSISPCGRDVVLASRQGLHVIDLDSPWAPPRHLSHHTPWEVADVQWSPFPARAHWVVSTSNQKALVWNLAMIDRNASVEHYLHAHNRAITDINFSAHHPDMLATCAVDSFVHCWDLRHPVRPAVTFCDWYAGATQVKWNRQDGHVIASSHDKFLRIWDDRKGAYPLRSIEAHDTKIYGLDWNRTREHALLTCSLDHTIKLWDYGEETNEPESTIRTPFPVWRARHTPFGWGMLAMPQRGDNNLYLYDRRGCEADGTSHCLPVKSFEGHKDQVKEFLWRSRGSIDNGIDNREFQLVSWGADHFLRLHSLSDDVLASAGYEKGKQVHQKLNLTRRNAPYKTFQEHPTKSEIPKEDSFPSYFSRGPTLEGFGIDIDSGITVQSRSAMVDGWASAGFVTTQLGIRTKTNETRDMDPITWMKGVKIGKKEPDLEQSTTSLVTPDFRAARGWEEFESLGEEVTHVGSKFSKVEFQEVNIKERFIRISMRGLWDSKESSTYLDCRVDFPDSYPHEGIPKLFIERTASIDEATIHRIQEDVQTIGSAHANFRRSSLEALLRYLQGDQTVDEAVAWTREDLDQSVADLQNDEESSSDEEDELGGFNENQNDELGLAGSGIINPVNANAYMPLPKKCNAIWARNGQLVCFFPPKEEKQTTSLANVLSLNEREGLPRGRRKVFEGFGKINKSLKSRSLVSSMSTWNSSESPSESDISGSERSSSVSSTSSRDLSSKGDVRFASHVFEPDRFGVHVVQSDRPVDETVHSNGSVSMRKNPPISSKTIISIHDFKSILPSKNHFARRYTHFGPEACENNRKVAAAKGEQDLADVWSLLDVLFSSSVPLRIIQREISEGHLVSYSIIRKSSQHKKGASATRNKRRAKESHGSGRVTWGQHPFGAAVLVKRLYRYFSQIADVQTIAMMSCILTPKEAHSRTTRDYLGNRKDGKPLSRSELRPEALTRDYFPTSFVAASLLKEERKKRDTQNPPKKFEVSPRLSSPLVEQATGTVTISSDEIESPAEFKAVRWDLNGTENPDILSSSPEFLRLPQKSTSNLASAFTAQLSRPFSFSASASSSPPNMAFPKKRISPIGSLVTKEQKGTSIEAPTKHDLKMMRVREARLPRNAPDFRFSERENRERAIGQGSVSRKKVTVCLRNQDQFELDGYPGSELLDVQEEAAYQGFREAYANMLAFWRQPMQRAEVLKHNDWSTKANIKRYNKIPNTLAADSLSIGKKSLGKEIPVAKTGLLDLGIHCPKCGATERPSTGQETTKCSNCSWKSKPLHCVLCNEAIRGRASPCLKCGHVMHISCRIQWLEETSCLDESCVTGCGCSCKTPEGAVIRWYNQEDQARRVPKPRHNSMGKKGKTSATNVDFEEKWKDIEEDLAYESLKGNLGVSGKSTIRPSKSQVWRGRERRGASMGTAEEHRDRNFWLGT